VKYAPGGYQLDEGYCVGKSRRDPYSALPSRSQPVVAAGMFKGDPALSFWILGQFAMQNWYTTFDYKDQRVGFSSLKETT
jgi:hypothetical protein